jgi:hypothetical protein
MILPRGFLSTATPLREAIPRSKLYRHLHSITLRALASAGALFMSAMSQLMQGAQVFHGKPHPALGITPATFA